MKIDETNIIGKVEDSFRACLQRVPFLEIKSLERAVKLGDACVDIVADVRVAKHRQRLAIEVKSNGQPRVARAAVYRLARVLKSDPGLYGVFAAPYISPRTAEICVQEKIGYLDLAGNCRLAVFVIGINQRPAFFVQLGRLRRHRCRQGVGAGTQAIGVAIAVFPNHFVREWT